MDISLRRSQSLRNKQLPRSTRRHAPRGRPTLEPVVEDPALANAKGHLKFESGPK
jgi:hypothetical protein